MKTAKTIRAINASLKIAYKSKLYKKKLKNSSISVLSDMRTIPLTTKQELRKSYPYGNLAVDFSDVIEMHTSSGVTGSPVLSFYTSKDLKVGSEVIAKAWSNFGINKKSRVQFMMSYGLFSGAMLNTYAIQSLGAFVLPAGIQPIARQVQFLQDFNIDTIVATPSYYLYLYDYFLQNKISIKKLKLKQGIAAGEIYSDKIKNKIAELFSIKIYDHYGLCEVNTGIVYECNSCGNMVVLDEYVYPEIVDPTNNKILSEGETGELVLTSLNKEASPVIRYKTGDITFIKTRFSTCNECYGRIILGRVKARCDSVIFYKGIKIEPFELRDEIILFAGDKIYNRVKIQINKKLSEKQLSILIALKSGVNDSIIDALQKYLKKKIGIVFTIKKVPHSYFKEIVSTKEVVIDYVN